MAEIHNICAEESSVWLWNRVEIGLGYPGQLGHVLSGSSGSDPVYKISGSDPDSALDHMH